MSNAFFRFLYRLLILLGRPIGGIRPRRTYDILARRAFDKPDFQPFTNLWGDQLLLSHFYHIDRNILIFGTYDLELHQALARLLRPGMVAFDVGANLGEMALHMARLVGAGGQVWAFEPVPAVFQRLTGHVDRNSAGSIVHAVEIALSDQTGQATIAAPDESADNQGLGSIANLTDKAGPVRTTIRTMTLDDFVAEHRIERIDLMKIDIQGAEPRLLKGAQRTLSKMGPDLIMEFSPDDLRHSGLSLSGNSGNHFLVTRASRPCWHRSHGRDARVTDAVSLGTIPGQAHSGLTSRDLARQLDELGYHIHPLTRGGFGPAIDPSTLAENFAATNVLCTRRGI